jgi:eukaryotic-like serine/threonine-protein kinase
MALIDEAKPVLASARKSFGNEDAQVAIILHNMGTLLSDQGEFQRAEPLLNEAVQIRHKVLPPNDPEQASAQTGLVDCLLAMASYESAEQLLLTSYANLESTLGPKHERTVEAAKQLVRLYEAWNKPDKAQECRKLLPVEEQARAEANKSDSN